MKNISSYTFFSIFFLSMFLAFCVRAQKKGEFILQGTVMENEALRLEGATITVFEDNEKVLESFSSKKGYFELTLAMNKDYIIEFSKSQYVSKSISISTDPPKKCTIRQWGEDIGAVISLFKHVSGANYSIYKNPIAYYGFTEKCDFGKDENFAKTVSAMQGKVRDDVIKAQKENLKNPDKENKLKDEQDKQKQADEKYKQLIAAADEEFNDKDYENALQIYTEALKIKPGQIYPETQLTRIHARINDREKPKEKEIPIEQPALAKKTETVQPKPEIKKEILKPVQAIANLKEDLKKTEKKSEALLLRLTGDSHESNAELMHQREIEKENDVKNILAHTIAKRIFLEEIADSKMRMKQQIRLSGNTQ